VPWLFIRKCCRFHINGHLDLLSDKTVPVSVESRMNSKYIDTVACAFVRFVLAVSISVQKKCTKILTVY